MSLKWLRKIALSLLRLLYVSAVDKESTEKSNWNTDIQFMIDRKVVKLLLDRKVVKLLLSTGIVAELKNPNNETG